MRRQLSGAGRRRGLTLIEVTMAILIGSVVLAAALDLVATGFRLFLRGQEALAGPEAALALMDALEEDLAQALQVPGDPRPPVAILDGTRLTYLRTRPEPLALDRLVGAPASWDLERDGDDFRPVRDGRPMGSVRLLDWQLELLAPDGIERTGWQVQVDARVPPGRSGGEPFRIRRVISLPQPSSNHAGFLAGSVLYGGGVFEQLVQVEPPPEDDSTFDPIRTPAP